MPWSRTDPAKDRLELVLEWEGRWQAGRVNLSELCRELGISRETAYARLRRYSRPLERFEDHSDDRLRVDRHGYLRWERPRVFISTALAHEDVFVILSSTLTGSAGRSAGATSCRTSRPLAAVLTVDSIHSPRQRI